MIARGEVMQACKWDAQDYLNIVAEAELAERARKILARAK